MKIEKWTLILMYNKRKYDENAVSKRQMLYAAIKTTKTDAQF